MSGLVTSSCGIVHNQDMLEMADHLQVLHQINGLPRVNTRGTTIILNFETSHSEPYEMPFMKTVQTKVAQASNKNIGSLAIAVLFTSL